MARPKKYDPNKISQEQEDLITAILNDTKSTKGLTHVRSSGDVPSSGDDLKDVLLDEELIINALKQQGLRGNVKALELLGERLGIFDNGDKESLIDLFASEQSLEENIETILNVLEDKYPSVSAETLLHEGAIDRLVSLEPSPAALGAKNDTPPDLYGGEVLPSKDNKRAEPAKSETLVADDDGSEPEFVVPHLSLDKRIDVFSLSEEDDDGPVDSDLLDKALRRSKKVRADQD